MNLNLMMGIFKGFLPILILIILLSDAIQALGQIDTLDSKVCIGTTYRYRVEGSPGSIYIWKVNGVQQKTNNDYLEYTWTRTGFYIIELKEYQDNCEGEIKVYGVKVGLDEGCGCTLFIPNAFSPNEDDEIHKYFEIYCINPYPNARMYIFDQLGNKIFEKANYGNLTRWTKQEAWWNGKPDRGPGYARNENVPPGTYYYVLDLGNGEVKKSFVFVSY